MGAIYHIGRNCENHEFHPLLPSRAYVKLADLGQGELRVGKAQMTWRSYLRSKTRQAAFLWRMVLWMIVAGIALGYLVQRAGQPDTTKIVQTDRSDQAVERLKALAERGAWAQLWWAIPRVAFLRLLSPGPALLAALAGCCWLVFLWQAMRLPGGRDPRFWCAVVAIPLGMLSIWPTHFFGFWQEYAWNLQRSPQLIPGLRFFIFGVGLREELAKLLCLLPLMPVLLRVGDELTALVVSGCVGLGFAIVENAGYFASSGGSDVLGRFLTANPAHITLTGLVGLAVYRALRHPQAWGWHALGVFGVLVCAHGLYDAFIAVPVLVEYALFGTIVFALLVYQFFRELRSMRKPQGDTISLTANFLFGVSLLTAATFVYWSATVGNSIAFDMLATEATGLAVMVYLFLREMPESMVRV